MLLIYAIVFDSNVLFYASGFESYCKWLTKKILMQEYF